MSKFQKGDKVRCVDQSVGAHELTTGDTYTVERIQDQWHIELKELPGFHFAKVRFALVPPAPKFGDRFRDDATKNEWIFWYSGGSRNYMIGCNGGCRYISDAELAALTPIATPGPKYAVGETVTHDDSTCMKITEVIEQMYATSEGLTFFEHDLKPAPSDPPLVVKLMGIEYNVEWSDDGCKVGCKLFSSQLIELIDALLALDSPLPVSCGADRKLVVRRATVLLDLVDVTTTARTIIEAWKRRKEGK